ncbi:hypothetical protein Mro03_16090 [Microbispora rosea subsp. rosea]|nr:hypothetical protein Mro03_16090 [Microbispora rosea subsp. rosea]
MDLYDGGVEPQGPAQSVLTTPGTDDKYAHPTIVAVFACHTSGAVCLPLPARRRARRDGTVLLVTAPCSSRRLGHARAERLGGAVWAGIHIDGQFARAVFGKKCMIDGT